MSKPLERENVDAKLESPQPSGLSRIASDFQVASLPQSKTTMPAEFGTPILTGLYEDNPVGPVVPDPYHDGPQLGGHNSGSSPTIDIDD
ncbi:MAG: hypothetical protein JST89_21090 [Cyanobacteria bacterium SZAS-4]|nr:hypothetical protein [Cyanobacteria bacterium SZAS-4]